MTAHTIYRTAKMTGTAVGASLGYLLVSAHNLPENWRIGIGMGLAALGAVGLYVTPSPIHQSDVPVPVPPDVIDPPGA